LELKRVSGLKVRFLSISLLLSATTCQADGQFVFSTGIDYSSGTYGDTRHTETLYVPVTIKYERDDWTLKAIIPYVESSGPSDVVGRGTDRITLSSGQNNTHRKTAGLGDVVLIASWTAYQNSLWLIDIGTKIKLATADEKEGLGTGKNDYSLQTEVYRTIDSHTLFGTLGFKKMGEPDGVALLNPFYASLGWALRTSQRTSLGLAYDYRQKIQEGGAPISEASGFVTHKIDASWKLQAYVVSGFSKASPDLGGGIFAFYTY